jgi:hypothetical protein
MVEEILDFFDGALILDAEHAAGLLLSDELTLDAESVFCDFLSAVVVDLLVPDSSLFFLQVPADLVSPLQPTDQPAWS